MVSSGVLIYCLISFIQLELESRMSLKYVACCMVFKGSC